MGALCVNRDLGGRRMRGTSYLTQHEDCLSFGRGGWDGPERPDCSDAQVTKAGVYGIGGSWQRRTVLHTMKTEKHMEAASRNVYP